MWLDRIIQKQHHFGVWDMHTYVKIHTALHENHALGLAYLDKTSTEELDEIISYTNQPGNYYESVNSDCITHVINHSTYHRAQIARSLCELNIAPPNTDLITYCRQIENNE